MNRRTSPHRHRPGDRRHRPGDRGALTISLALVFPVVLGLVFLVVQAALYWYAGQAAQTAAREGADAGRVRGGTEAAGEARARAFLARVGDLADPVSVIPHDAPGTFRITVEVRPLAVLPGFDRFTVTREVTAPREKFVPQVGQP
ncbi:Flp pilus assembly protein TadG [Kitasatospora gansuensis]|uniref:Flp pilus assembly protein TadG n=1 Tax=Kitasatospora gansuensis TaxID=258050 RepID=A0A7W7WGH3_9ACTN|nr:TadE/TadG family type IV pilus assembly protein [Kitasatospora gansuensis]MBB4945615.1 Flp pilus assembly protein TadG [Kitasatospora gansuensis]